MPSLTPQLGEPALLWRRVDTRTYGTSGPKGRDWRHLRGTKRERASDATRGSMHGKTLRGLDDAPLFRFLLASVGRPWNDVHSEAVRRLARAEPIGWRVARGELERREIVRCGESSHWSGLHVDDTAILRIVNPSLGPADLEPRCPCCTHTFNGKRIAQRYATDRVGWDVTPPGTQLPDPR